MRYRNGGVQQMRSQQPGETRPVALLYCCHDGHVIVDCLLPLLGGLARDEPNGMDANEHLLIERSERGVAGNLKKRAMNLAIEAQIAFLVTGGMEGVHMQMHRSQFRNIFVVDPLASR